MQQNTSQIIYTTGYSGKDIEDLKPLVETLNAVLVDIRFSPTSQVLRWRRQYLQLLLKNRYRHVPDLGNRTYKEGKIMIQNLSLGIKTVQRFGINAILLCVCEEFRQCHRFVVAQELRSKSIPTQELSDWKTLETTLL